MPTPTAFQSALPLASSLALPQLSLKSPLSPPIRRPYRNPTRINLPCMQTTPPDSTSSSTDSSPEADQSTTPQPTTSAAEILRTLREDSARDNTPKAPSMLGVYRDVDGKSNVWAVEPLEETDTRPQLSKATLIAAAAGFIVLALLVLPLLPFTNPDQL